MGNLIPAFLYGIAVTLVITTIIASFNYRAEGSTANDTKNTSELKSSKHELKKKHKTIQ